MAYANRTCAAVKFVNRVTFGAVKALLALALPVILSQKENHNRSCGHSNQDNADGYELRVRHSGGNEIPKQLNNRMALHKHTESNDGRKNENQRRKMFESRPEAQLFQLLDQRVLQIAWNFCVHQG
jgi:hypothetical protein